MAKLFTLKSFLFINLIQYLHKTKSNYSNYRNINKLEFIFNTINYTKHWKLLIIGVSRPQLQVMHNTTAVLYLEKAPKRFTRRFNIDEQWRSQGES